MSQYNGVMQPVFVTGVRIKLVIALSCIAMNTVAQTNQASTVNGYLNPPKAIVDVLDAPRPPVMAGLTPKRTHLIFMEAPAYPSLSELAQPVEAIAGIRFNALNRSPQTINRFTDVWLKAVNGGAQVRFKLPVGAHVSQVSFSPNGRWVAMARVLDDRLELLIGNCADGAVRSVPNVTLNGVPNLDIEWVGDEDRVLVTATSDTTKEAARPTVRVATAPAVQESVGRAGTLMTFPDLLKNTQDEAVFERFSTSQIVQINVTDLSVKKVGLPAIVQSMSVSPNKKYLMINSIQKPFSYVVPYWNFASKTQVLNLETNGSVVVNERGVQDRLPAEGVPIGPRSFVWNPHETATLIFAQALDGGDPKNAVPHRDELFILNEPFSNKPNTWAKVVHRYQGTRWLSESKRAWVADYDRDKKQVTHALIDAKGASEVLFSLNINERYKDPGSPVTMPMANGKNVILERNGKLLLRGQGATPQGDRPFMDRFDLANKTTERLFHSDPERLQAVLAPLDDDAKAYVYVSQSLNEPPNYFLRQGDDKPIALTDYKDPSPILRKISKQLVTYDRADGVKLSFTLYLPPDYDVKSGKKLPALLWAYPMEFTDASTAGQVSGSTKTFTQIRGSSPLFMALAGYAVMMDATMPVVGEPKVVNDTFVQQVVDSAKAAVDKAATLGVDPDRVVVAGHSYGAFMTANLLAHSDVFRAGIARSGAYNRTLTPFGFQGERRNFWEAKELYQKISPFNFAEKINEPLLMIHGEIDDNPGTFPIQSERMYQAIRGVGGTVRLVMLPHEKHGYRARESVGHTLAEMLGWMEKYATARAPKTATLE